jgi:hypothetical protein
MSPGAQSSPPYASHSREFVDGHGTNAWNRIEIGY